MPIEIKDCDGGIGVRLVFQGVVSDKEYLESLERHLTQDNERFKKYRYSLTDLSALTEVNVTNATIQQVAYLCEEASKINPDPLVAFFADNDLFYGLSRMFETLVMNTNWETMAFRSRNEAVEWIRERVREKFGIDDLTFQ